MMRLVPKALVFFSLLALPASVLAETPVTPTGAPTSTATTTATATAPAAGTVTAKLELRPTWGTNSGRVEAQNNAEVGYHFTPNTKLLFNQSFNFDVRNTKSTGMNFTLPDARIELDLNNAWVPGPGWSVDYQPRLHVPTDSAKRDVGLITEFRHQFNLNHVVSPTFAWTASIIPAVHAYSKRGGVLAGKLQANPLFENRLEFVAKWKFARNWKIELPLKFWQTRFQSFQTGARFNDSWAFIVNIKPEISWQFDRNLAVGVAFETASFFSDDLSRATFGDAFKNANAQLALIATL